MLAQIFREPTFSAAGHASGEMYRVQKPRRLPARCPDTMDRALAIRLDALGPHYNIDGISPDRIVGFPRPDVLELDGGGALLQRLERQHLLAAGS